MLYKKFGMAHYTGLGGAGGGFRLYCVYMWVWVHLQGMFQRLERF